MLRSEVKTCLLPQANFDFVFCSINLGKMPWIENGCLLQRIHVNYLFFVSRRIMPIRTRRFWWTESRWRFRGYFAGKTFRYMYVGRGNGRFHGISRTRRRQIWRILIHRPLFVAWGQPYRRFGWRRSTWGQCCPTLTTWSLYLSSNSEAAAKRKEKLVKSKYFSM